MDWAYSKREGDRCPTVFFVAKNAQFQAFWEKISALATRVGRSVRNLSAMVRRMPDEHNALLSAQAKETGTAQQGEYEQTMALWKEQVDSVGLQLEVTAGLGGY